MSNRLNMFSPEVREHAVRTIEHAVRTILDNGRIITRLALARVHTNPVSLSGLRLFNAQQVRLPDGPTKPRL